MGNLTSTASWSQPTKEFIPIGPLKIGIKLPEDVQGRSLKLLVSGQKIFPEIKDGWMSFSIPSINDHEVVVVY